ncbi:MAG: hypothetical protein ACFFBP_14300 [Promethearchaeota archaeon]
MVENNNKMKEENSAYKSIFNRLENVGLNYINHEKMFLLISAVVPIFIVSAQFISLVFQLILNLESYSAPPKPRPSPPLFEVLLPIILLLIIGIFALINYLFLLRWKNKLKNYKIQQLSELNIKNYDKEIENLKNQLTLTDFFYGIIKNMRIIRNFFIVLNLFCLFYIVWYYTSYFQGLPPQRPFLLDVIIILTIGSQAILIIYILYEWYHLIKWNSKLKALKKYERQIYLELFSL